MIGVLGGVMLQLVTGGSIGTAANETAGDGEVPDVVDVDGGDDVWQLTTCNEKTPTARMIRNVRLVIIRSSFLYLGLKSGHFYFHWKPYSSPHSGG